MTEPALDNRQPQHDQRLARIASAQLGDERPRFVKSFLNDQTLDRVWPGGQWIEPAASSRARYPYAREGVQREQGRHQQCLLHGVVKTASRTNRAWLARSWSRRPLRARETSR